ncbi:MAG TPA: hypothetical protein VFX61_08275 [Micromonosporaceae bacterium]|nr:hypothetical protein [Micromonosporaceae bacterium]
MTDLPVYTQFGFTDEQWGLLVGLPQSVVTAASAAERDGTRRTRAEGAAGLDAIARGRESASRLVAAVAAELVVQVGDPELGEELPLIEPLEPSAMIADVLERARVVSVLLDNTVDEGEAGAYRHWLVTLADEVVGAALSGGKFGIGGELVSEAERRFRDELARALED